MEWKKYEQEIFHYFKENYPDCQVLFDQKIIGRYSKVERQIDILIIGEVAGYSIKIVVDCKSFSKKLDVKQVDSFCSMVDDVDSHQGILISRKGYTPAAINRAFYGNQKIELDVINFDEIKEFQGLLGFPYTENFMAILPAPFGWILNSREKSNSFPTIHQRGLDLIEAKKQREWMYFDFWKKENEDFTIDNLIDIQNKTLFDIDTKANLTYLGDVKREDKFRTKIRIADIDSYPSLEITGFIDFETHIFFIVLFTPKELQEKNMRKLLILLKRILPTKVIFDYHEGIKQVLAEIENTIDANIKAEKYYKIAIWYKKMNDLPNAMVYFKKGIAWLPTHFGCLENLIKETLNQELYDETFFYASKLFDSESTNPAVPQLLIKLFGERVILLLNFFVQKLKEYDNQEVLGNINFHMGLIYGELDDRVNGKICIANAKNYLESVFPPENDIFELLANLDIMFEDIIDP